jgi:hypothetical protein
VNKNDYFVEVFTNQDLLKQKTVTKFPKSTISSNYNENAERKNVEGKNVEGKNVENQMSTKRMSNEKKSKEKNVDHIICRNF